MTQEEKDLVLKELCTRLPYRVICKRYENAYELVDIDIKVGLVYLLRGEQYVPYSISAGDEIKPYLRQMSSMTEEEKRELQSFFPGSFGGQWLNLEKGYIEIYECESTTRLYLYDAIGLTEWLNKKMFDYRGLIEKGLAIEAPEGMYN